MAETRQIDPHTWLMGRERMIDDGKEIFGRTEGDAEQLFPKFTHAKAASTGEVEINGKKVLLWTYQQLEALTPAVLKQRAATLRDALGEQNCPPIPSGRPQEITQWILHVQEDVSDMQKKIGRITTVPRKTCLVPSTFHQDITARPIEMHRDRQERQDHIPFGRRPNVEAAGGRDNFHNLKHELPEAPASPGSPRSLTKHGPSRFDDFDRSKPDGVPGKRHYGHGSQGKDNMQGAGVSEADVDKNVPAGGRRVIGCYDNIFEQKKHNEAVQDGRYVHPPAPEVPSPRSNQAPVRHVSETYMGKCGISEPVQEPHIGGERRRHINPGDSMLNNGTSTAEAVIGTVAASGSARGSGRKYNDGFHTGNMNSFSGYQPQHQQTWKKDPSRLLGNSLLV